MLKMQTSCLSQIKAVLSKRVQQELLRLANNYKPREQSKFCLLLQWWTKIECLWFSKVWTSVHTSLPLKTRKGFCYSCGFGNVNKRQAQCLTSLSVLTWCFSQCSLLQGNLICRIPSNESQSKMHFINRGEQCSYVCWSTGDKFCCWLQPFSSID